MENLENRESENIDLRSQIFKTIGKALTLLASEIFGFKMSASQKSDEQARISENKSNLQHGDTSSTKVEYASSSTPLSADAKKAETAKVAENKNMNTNTAEKLKYLIEKKDKRTIDSINELKVNPKFQEKVINFVYECEKA